MSLAERDAASSHANDLHIRMCDWFGCVRQAYMPVQARRAHGAWNTSTGWEGTLGHMEPPSALAGCQMGPSSCSRKEAAPADAGERTPAQPCAQGGPRPAWIVRPSRPRVRVGSD